jgi:hypothetical protein
MTGHSLTQIFNEFCKRQRRIIGMRIAVPQFLFCSKGGMPKHMVVLMLCMEKMFDVCLDAMVVFIGAHSFTTLYYYYYYYYKRPSQQRL